MSTIFTIVGFVLFAAALLSGAILSQSDWHQDSAASREPLDTDGETKSPAP
jgi:hypothetical protein